MASGSILIGRIFDDVGNRMTPVSAQRGAIRYRYYVSAPINDGAVGGKGSISGVSAPDVEKLVSVALQERIGETGSSSFDEATCQKLVEAHVTRVTVSRTSVEIQFEGADDESNGVPETVIKPLVRINRTPRREILRGSEEDSDPNRGMRSENHRRLVTSIARARRWAADLASGEMADLATLAKRDGCSERHVRMALPLAFLAPDIVRAALSNRPPPRIAMSKVWSDLPFTWADQRTVFGAGSPVKA